MADKKAQLIIEGAAPVELPILTGTVGPDVIDVRGLTATGRFTFDPGFMSTASCESKITYIDGDNGILLHRGYPIEQLAEHSDYLETAYLLLNGELPTAEQKAQFVSTVKNHTMVHEQLKTFFNGFRRDAHPMAVLTVLVGAIMASAAPAIVVFAQELVPGRTGLIAGLFFGFAFGMGGIAAAALGVLADSHGIRFVYLICSGLPALGILTILLPKRREFMQA